MTGRMLPRHTNISYEFIKNPKINAHSLFHRFTRDLDDPMLTSIERELTDTSYLTKNILGVTSENSLFKDKLRMSAFAKRYMQNVSLIDPEKVDGIYVPRVYKRDLTSDGFGGAISYSITPQFMISVSGEKALRLPYESELLGNTT